MSGWEVVEVDVQDEAQLRAWWQAAHAAERDRPYDFFPSWEVFRLTMPTPDPNAEQLLLGIPEGGSFIAAAKARFPRHDNTHMMMANFWVRPESRRRGAGTLLVEAAEAEARRRGRTVVLTDTSSPPGQSGAGEVFAAALGYVEANLDEGKVLDLAAAERGWDALEAEAEAAAAAGDYRVELWKVIPEEHLAGYCALLNGFLSQIPLGDLALEDMNYTPELMRENEARARQIGRESFISAAIAPDGSIAGSSDVNIKVMDPRTAIVGITLVLPEHRGHRLGLALKLANHRALRAAHPECEIIATSNATVNEHMNTINERMGYRVVEQLHELQKRL